MFFYVIANEKIQKVTTDSNEYNSLMGRKTCHKKFVNKNDANHFLKVFRKYYETEYNAFIDFEFTCANKKADYKFPKIQGEILSVGICITNNSGDIIDEFYRTIKPKYNYTLTNYCKALTHLEQSEIDNADDLPTVFSEAIDFIEKYNITKLNAFGTSDYLQSMTDIEHFIDNKDYIKMSKFVNKIVNIQSEIIFCLINSKLEISLEDAKKLCGITGIVKHNALEDAKDLSRVVFATFFNPPSLKKVNRYKDFRNSKIKYNQNRRIKTFQRDYSEEEKQKFLEICNILQETCNTDDIKIQTLIDDLLYLSKQDIIYGNFSTNF